MEQMQWHTNQMQHNQPNKLFYDIATCFSIRSHHQANLYKISTEMQEKKEPTDDTSIDVYSQQVNSACFGQHHAHRQENRLYKTVCGVGLDMLTAIVWSQDMS